MRERRSSSNALLDLELRLLVARHGRKRVHDTLSRIGEVDPSALESMVEALDADAKTEQARPRSNRSAKSVDELLGDFVPLASEVRDLLEKLGNAYEAKTFLPALREVKSFLELRGESVTRLRSRREALPRILRTLACLPVEELRSIDAERLDKRGDLEVIADQILGPRVGTPENKLDTSSRIPTASEAHDAYSKAPRARP